MATKTTAVDVMKKYAAYFAGAPEDLISFEDAKLLQFKLGRIGLKTSKIMAHATGPVADRPGGVPEDVDAEQMIIEGVDKVWGLGLHMDLNGNRMDMAVAARSLSQGGKNYGEMPVTVQGLLAVLAGHENHGKTPEQIVLASDALVEVMNKFINK